MINGGIEFTNIYLGTGRATVVSHIQSIMILTKARDNHLIPLTSKSLFTPISTLFFFFLVVYFITLSGSSGELALWLMKTPRNGRDRGLIV